MNVGSSLDLNLKRRKIEAIESELARLHNALLNIFDLSSSETEGEGSRCIELERAVPLSDQSDNGRYSISSRPSMPDPKLLEVVISNRQKRREHFGRALVADPAWDMILDLAIARARFRRVSVSSLCIASGVPSTTALRWIKVLAEEGLIQREGDSQDKRRTFISLTDKGIQKIARYFAMLESPNSTPTLI